jgi:copper chaperone
LALDWLIPSLAAALPKADPMLACHSDKVDWISNSWSIALLLVIGLSYAWPAHSAADPPDPPHEHDRETGEHHPLSNTGDAITQKLELQISGMTCQHCVAAVTRALLECKGVQNVSVDLKNGRAIVVGIGLDEEKLLEAVKSLGL